MWCIDLKGKDEIFSSDWSRRWLLPITAASRWRCCSRRGPRDDARCQCRDRCQCTSRAVARPASQVPVSANLVPVFVTVPSVLWRSWLGGRKGVRPVKTEWWGVLAWLSLWSKMQTYIWSSWCHCHSLSCFSKIQIGFTFLVPADLGSPGKRAVKQVCVFLLQFSYTPGEVTSQNL